MKKIVYIFSFLIFLSSSMFYACKKDKPTEPPIDFGYNYFPDEVGRYIIYEVDSIAYDDVIHKPDTTKYLLKEQVVSISPDNSNRPTMKIERYYKIFKNGQYDSVWTGPRIWTANKTATTAERKEENITYLKLIFPVRESKKWNGNTYNTLGEKIYEFTSVDLSETIGVLHFDSVPLVAQSFDDTFIQHFDEREKYARNVGLIYKKRDSIYWGGGPDSVGFAFTQKIVSYGK